MSIIETTVLDVDVTLGDGNSKEFSGLFRVRTDDPTHGPIYIAENFGGAKIGNSYDVNGERDGGVRCVKINPRRHDDNKKLWDVAVDWNTPDIQNEQQGIDDKGRPTNDPLKFRSKVDLSVQQMQRPVEKAILRTRLRGRRINTVGPVTNSAGVPYDPPLEKDYAIYVVRVTKNLPAFPNRHWSDYQNAVNKDAWNLTRRFPKLKLKLKPYTCKMQSISGSMQLQNNKLFWQVVYEFHVDTDFGWRRDVVDKGRSRLACAGDPIPGAGGLVYQQRVGRPPVMTIKDDDGFPVHEDLLLDGRGEPLPCGGKPFYINYSVYPELPFKKLKL